jgi:hypothetical protein
MAPRKLLVCALVLCAAGCGAEEEPAAPGGGGAATALLVTVDRDGEDGRPAQEREIRCAAGDSSGACAAAARLRPSDFQPVPRDQACTQIFGGPETARVEGELNGEPVAATFNRSNGCEIARWDAVAELLDAVR